VRIPKHRGIVKRMIDARVKKLGARGPVLAASLVQIAKHCGRPGCKCHTRGEKHTGNYLTFKEDGKTRTVYVPLDLLKEVHSWIAEHHRLKQLDKEVSRLVVAYVRGYVEDQKRKKGRS